MRRRQPESPRITNRRNHDLKEGQFFMTQRGQFRMSFDNYVNLSISCLALPSLAS